MICRTDLQTSEVTMQYTFLNGSVQNGVANYLIIGIRGNNNDEGIDSPFPSFTPTPSPTNTPTPSPTNTPTPAPTPTPTNTPLSGTWNEISNEIGGGCTITTPTGSLQGQSCSPVGSGTARLEWRGPGGDECRFVEYECQA